MITAMQLRYNFRVYPEPGRRIALAKAFGCARVVFNDRLRARREAHAAGLPYIKDTDLQKRVITAAERTDERAWLGEVSSVVLVQPLRDSHTAYRNFFSSVIGTRKDPKVAPPRFKSLDLGLNHFAVLADGRKAESPKFLRRAEKKLKRMQKALSRKAKGSENRDKARKKAACRHARVADRRRDWHHKLSPQIIRDDQAVFVETLSAQGLARTRLAKSVQSQVCSAPVPAQRVEAGSPRDGHTTAVGLPAVSDGEHVKP